MMQYITLGIVVFAAGFVLLALAVFLRYRELWQRAQMAHCKQPFVRLILLHHQGVPVRVLLDSYIRTRHAKIDVPFERYLTLYRSGGNPTRVSMALVTARAAHLDLDFDTLADIELHKQDAFEHVQSVMAQGKMGHKMKVPQRYVYE